MARFRFQRTFVEIWCIEKNHLTVLKAFFLKTSLPARHPKWDALKIGEDFPLNGWVPKLSLVKDYQRDSAKRHEKCKVDGQIHLPSLIFSCILFFWWWSSKHINSHKPPPLLPPRTPQAVVGTPRKEKFNFLPLQTTPSPSNPGLQVQLKDPFVLKQSAFSWHGLESHSLISSNKKRRKNTWTRVMCVIRFFFETPLV